MLKINIRGQDDGTLAVHETSPNLIPGIPTGRPSLPEVLQALWIMPLKLNLAKQNTNKYF